VKFDIQIFFRKSSDKLKFHKNLTIITDTLHEDQYTFVIISRSILHRMRNVSDKSCRENQNKHFIFNKSFSKNHAFMRKCKRIWYSRTGHRWQYNMVHARGVLDNWDYRHTLRI